MNYALITNFTFALPATGLQVVVENPCSGRAGALSNLLTQTFIVTWDHEPNNIRSKELSMVHVLKAMASHLILGNFATNGVTNAHNEANSVNLLTSA